MNNTSRHFNIAGPNRPSKHYTLPPLARLPHVMQLVQDEAWFVLHAPRQTGKTTAMRALAQELTASGSHAALWATCEAGEPYSHDPSAVERLVCESITTNASLDLPMDLRPPPVDGDAPAGAILSRFLRAWCESCPRPVVLLLDEIDALQDEALISVLRQLRGIYPNHPAAAPSSVALIGLRDVRDYKVAVGEGPYLGTASPFNIKAESLTLGDFTPEEVVALYGQHTEDTGQAFTPEAAALAWEVTRGQPWLVNALVYQLTRKLQIESTIDAAHVERAKELLVLSRSTHLDSLADKLNEPRVRSVVSPLLTGEPSLPPRPSDVDYVVDLGLIRRTARGIEIANPIYQEVLPRELSVSAGDAMPHTGRMAARSHWRLPDGRLDLRGVLDAFVDFWREHGEWMVRHQEWSEAAHQLIVMAFLQRLVNGGGTIAREYGLGRGRLDLLIRWAITVDAYGCIRSEDRHALELKVWRDGQKDPLASGIIQLDGYLRRLGLTTGTLMIFDGRSAAPAGDGWATRGQLSEHATPTGFTVTVIRL